MNILAPSILAADFSHLGDCIAQAEAEGAQYLHIDVMDGTFVPSISFGMPLISSIRSATGMVFDVHLMVQEPGRYIQDFARCGADILTVHAEACTHLDNVLDSIHAAGCRAGIALNPATPLCVLDYVVHKADMILVMTVNPGFGGQKLISVMPEKVRQLRSYLDARGLKADIEVDGGINEETVRSVLEAGANVIVAGTAVFGGDITANTAKMMQILREYD